MTRTADAPTAPASAPAKTLLSGDINAPAATPWCACGNGRSRSRMEGGYGRECLGQCIPSTCGGRCLHASRAGQDGLSTYTSGTWQMQPCWYNRFSRRWRAWVPRRWRATHGIQLRTAPGIRWGFFCDHSNFHVFNVSLFAPLFQAKCRGWCLFISVDRSLTPLVHLGL